MLLRVRPPELGEQGVHFGIHAFELRAIEGLEVILSQ